MLSGLSALLQAATAHGYALGAFNIYNLEGVRAVIRAAEAERSPVILQLHPSALAHGGSPLVALCLEAARSASVPVAVHLDHSSSAAAIADALSAGVTSIMADGSHLPYADNIAFTRAMVCAAQAHKAAVEAELGRLSGMEDGLTVPEYEAKLTDPEQAAEFVTHTGIAALAVCIGNVHGRYRSEPRLDFARLQAIQTAVSVPLVLHGTSGLPEAMIQRAMQLGVCKFNVNTEVREAYLGSVRQAMQTGSTPDLLELMQHAEAAMQAVVVEKLRAFGSVDRA
jgi:tagatose 1,6-diphosphate aldolase GatY/KbaY